MISGKRIHGTCAIPGGMNKTLSKAERDYLLEDIDQIIAWSLASVALIKKVHCANLPYNDEFATIRSNYLGLTKPDGALELYHGGIRAKMPRVTPLSIISIIVTIPITSMRKFAHGLI